MLSKGIAEETELDAIDGQAAADVAEAAQYALDSPEPDPAHVMDGMYVEGAYPL